MEANHLKLQDNYIQPAWAAGGNVQINSPPAFKGQIDIGVNGHQMAPGETFLIQFNSGFISPDHEILISPTLQAASLTDTEIHQTMNGLNVQTSCVAGIGQIFFKNVSGANLPAAPYTGTVLSYTYLFA